MKKDLLGKQVEDLVSGFKGVAVSKITYMNGCEQYSLQPKCKEDGRFLDSKWFDAEQVALVSNKKVVEKKKKRTGGPAPTSVPHRGM